MKRIFPFLIFLQSCMGWGDMFAHKEKIIGKYFLLEDERTGGYSIYYKIDDDSYLGRNPENSKVLSYSIKDSLLIMESQLLSDTSINYYVLNMNKDNLYADAKDLIIDSIKKESYNSSWLRKQNLVFKKVED